MISTFQSIILGAVQGITEFLPVSSSGHLVAIPYIFNWNYNGLTFDVALHLGTLIALIVFFWRDWVIILKNAFTPKEAAVKYPRNFLWQILVATIPAAIIGVAIDKYVEHYFHQPLLLALNFVVFGLLLWIVDARAKQSLKVDKLGYKNSFMVGLAQSVALIPGISRSGITIIAGRSIGLNREDAARFSFLLAFPATLGAFALKAKDMAAHDINFAFIAGVITAAIFGVLAIKFMFNFLKKSDYSIFAYYRFVFAIILASVYFLR